jgi:hypothetical protein
LKSKGKEIGWISKFKFFIKQGLGVHSIKPCSSSFNTDCIDHFCQDSHEWNENRRYQNMIRKLDEEFYFSDWINSVNNLRNYSNKQVKLLNKKNMT